jgi:large subunit ribosomal protein L35
MPKLKTKSGVKKRFKLTATGKLKHGVAGKRHRLISHNAKYIRQNRGTEVLSDADTAAGQALGALRPQLRSSGHGTHQARRNHARQAQADLWTMRRAITAAARTRSASPARPSKRPGSTPIATAR